MVSDAATMTLGATATLAASVSASALSTPTSAPIFQGADPSAPFGQVNQSVLLPAGAAALQEELSARGFQAEVRVSRRRSDPWDFRVPSPHEPPQDVWEPSRSTGAAS